MLVEFFERNQGKKNCCCYSLDLAGLLVMCLTLSDVSTSYFGSYNMAPLGRCKTNNVAKVKPENSLPVDFYSLCRCALIHL